ncbi:putative ABC-type transport system, permease component [Vibrio coralliirubri]|uniref:ABC-type transport system, permease component n=1 Tax=Vibrio coralliirubri TaxID=1516159 RepID=A0AA86WWA1_9VIBR|nr:carbohydrate ABC transporter permease [Vibrio coralliirubri]CDT91351.1 putative ABC-type transport system, permease component [Vibrio coralliirubri]
MMNNANFARIFIYSTLLFFCLVYLMPLFVMVLTSFKTLPDIKVGNLMSLPKEWVFDAWYKAWDTACTGVKCEGIKGYFWNSFQMVIPAVAISTLLGAFNGYVVTKWQFRGSNLFFSLLLFGCFIPFQVVLLPMATMLGKMGLANTTIGLVIVHVIYGMAFTTLFFRNFYISIPDELIKAAKLDGAGFFTIFFKILLPISTPIIMVTVIWQFTAIWNDFLFGVVYSGSETQPITVALNNLVNTSTGVKEYNVDMAAAIIAALPTLLVYVFAGKYFVRGLTAGSVKG